MLRQESLKKSRKAEFVSGRILRNFAFGKQEVNYDNTGAPYIDNESFISLSHSGKWVALAVSPFHIALDIEMIDAKAVRVSIRFIAEAEKKWFDDTSERDMSLLWSFKEVLYKLAPRNGIHFKTELLISRSGNCFLGWIKTGNSWLCYPLEYRQVDNYFLTCNASTPTKHNELPASLLV